MEKNTTQDDSICIGHYPCIGTECETKRDCDSSDGLAIYQHEDKEGKVWYDGYCWSAKCNQYFNKDLVHYSSLAPLLGIKGGKVTSKKMFKAIESKKDPITIKEAHSFSKEIGYTSNNYRGIKDQYNKFYGHLTRINSQGSVVARYYPETKEGKITGYKSRIHPKKFGYDNKGVTGSKSDLSGQVKFNSGGKYLLITGGEEDKAAAFQMLRESQIARGQEHYEPIAVVSPTTGEGSAHKQIAANYEFCDSFDIIVLGLDNDKAGIEATKRICKVLPEDKIKVAKWAEKDPNTMLLNGKSAQFVRDFYGAKEYVATEIKHSSDAYDEAIEFLSSDKIELPPYLHRLQKNMRGGIKTTGAIINLIGDTSIGKSLFTDSLLYHWFWHSPIKPTIISLERTSGELGVDFISMHLKNNLSWYENGDDAVAIIKDPDNKDKIQDLLTNNYGEPRYHVLDERSGDIENIMRTIDRASKQYESNLIIIDPLTDLLRSLGNESQEEFMAWEKRRKKDGLIFINVLHTRKPLPDKEGNIRKVTEYDALGSGTFVQSADANIVINRNKMAEDPIERNTTCIDLPKIRGGSTGHAGDIYYEYTTRTLHDSIDYFKGKDSELKEDLQEDSPNF